MAGDMHECFHCGKSFDETEVSEREREDYTLDEDWNDIPIMRNEFLCPHCESWTE